MNFKRKKCRRTVRCTMCTKYRWFGNSRKGGNLKQHKLDQIKE